MKRALLTGISGTGKSTVINRLGALGYKAVDTDYRGFTVDVDSGQGTEQIWREERIQVLLSTDDSEVLVISGTSRNQVKFYSQFDHVVLLMAPAHVLVERLRKTNEQPVWENASDVEETIRLVRTVEPMLRGPATLEIDTSAPLEHVSTAIIEHALPNGS